MTPTIKDQIDAIDRELEIAHLECRAAEARQQTDEIMRAWDKRDGLVAKRRALVKERDKSPTQRRREALAANLELAREMALRRLPGRLMGGLILK